MPKRLTLEESYEVAFENEREASAWALKSLARHLFLIEEALFQECAARELAESRALFLERRLLGRRCRLRRCVGGIPRDHRLFGSIDLGLLLDGNIAKRVEVLCVGGIHLRSGQIGLRLCHLGRRHLACHASRGTCSIRTRRLILQFGGRHYIKRYQLSAIAGH